MKLNILPNLKPKEKRVFGAHGELLVVHKKPAMYRMMIGGAICFIGGMILVYLMSRGVFNTSYSTGKRVECGFLIFLGTVLAVTGWNAFTDGSELIEVGMRKMVIHRTFRDDIEIVLRSIRKVRLRRRYLISPLRGIPGRKMLNCYIETTTGLAYATTFDGKPGEEEFIQIARERQILKEGSEQELEWYYEGR